MLHLVMGWVAWIVLAVYEDFAGDNRDELQYLGFRDSIADSYKNIYNWKNSWISSVNSKKGRSVS